MKKALLKFLIVVLILIAYLLLGHFFHLYFRCPIYTVTKLYCPGCGLTRMLLSILKLDFYQAFRYNPLIFIMLPFIIFLYIEKTYSETKNKKSISKKIPNYVWYIILIIVLLYGILRNIIPYLEPTVI